MAKKNKKKTPQQKVIHEYDHALKQLFSHPWVVESLLRKYVPEKWISELDFSSLYRENVQYTTDDLRTRSNDIIWRINFQNEPLYILCMFEFQSSMEHFMAVRILNYTGLMYLDLIKQKKLDRTKTLPPVFPLVFYAGDSPWTAPLSLKECFYPFLPEELANYQPLIRYAILDVGRVLLENDPDWKDNFVALVIGIEQAENRVKLNALLKIVVETLKDEVFNRVRKDFFIYLSRAARVQNRFTEINLDQLSEDSIMLGDRMDRWEQEWLKQGISQGIEQGIEQGIAKGVEQTLVQERTALLSMLLQKKWGAIPTAIQYKIERASSEELKSWISKALHEEELAELENS